MKNHTSYILQIKHWVTNRTINLAGKCLNDNPNTGTWKMVTRPYADWLPSESDSTGTSSATAAFLGLLIPCDLFSAETRRLASLRSFTTSWHPFFLSVDQIYQFHRVYGRRCDLQLLFNFVQRVDQRLLVGLKRFHLSEICAFKPQVWVQKKDKSGWIPNTNSEGLPCLSEVPWLVAFDMGMYPSTIDMEPYPTLRAIKL